MLKNDWLNSVENLTDENKIKAVIQKIITTCQRRENLSIEELGNYFQEAFESALETEVYFEVADTCFPELDLYGSDCLTVEETLPLLEHYTAFQTFKAEIDFKKNTYIIYLTFDWVDPIQFKTVATAALNDMLCCENNVIDETLTSLSKCLSWDSIYTKVLQITNIKFKDFVRR